MKRIKPYTLDEISKKKYAIIDYDYEDGIYLISGLFDDEVKAKKKCKKLNEHHIQKMSIVLVDSSVVTTDDGKIKKCENVEGYYEE